MKDDFYRALFAAMQEAVLVAELVDRPPHPIDFRYLDVNPAAERLLGLRREQIVGRTGRELIPDIQEDLVELCARVVRTGVSETRDVYEPLVQQHHHTVFFRPAPGQVAVLFNDITSHRRTEEALAATASSLERERRRLEVLVSSIDDHLVSYDAEWRFTFVNEAAAAAIGLPADQLIGRSIWDLFPDAVGNQFHEHLHTAVRENRVIRSEHYYERFNRWFDNHIYPTPGGVTVFASDVTARKRAEAALRESEERFRVMADSLALLVWVHGTDGAQEFVNQRACEFFGLTREEMRGARWEQLVHPDDYERYVGTFRAALAGRQPFQEVARVRRADGEWRWVESWGRPRFSGSGEFTGLVGASADVTDRLAVEQALRDADRRKNEFLATLAHELRNPLAAIRSAVDVVRAAVPVAGQASGALQILDRQVAHMVRQVDDLLDVSRISRGRIELRREPTDLVRVVQQAIEAFEVGSRAHALEVLVPGHPLYVNGDATRLGQVVGNLLSNALKFGGSAGRIQVTVLADQGHAVLRVRDEGIGIAPDHLDRIFDMFTQLDTPPEVGRSGLGVGLSLVRTLVEQHGGTVRASSAGPGRGAEFTVRLPLSEDARPLVAKPAHEPSTAGVRRILVVDDNRDAADMLAMLLAHAGHDVATAYDGADAIGRSSTFRPDVVLMDIGMPGMNGYETARRLRQRDGAMRLVALTGWGAEADRRRSIDAGFDAHLIKPASIEQVTALLAEWSRS